MISRPKNKTFKSSADKAQKAPRRTIKIERKSSASKNVVLLKNVAREKRNVPKPSANLETFVNQSMLNMPEKVVFLKVGSRL
ncbi:hypothetical protein AGMMS50296_3650 [Alphaproteobacteria bacterium]|nr:hypothetical protein AGMMS50296_3650 [Alphaproteobacteria bacterium]